MTAAIPSVPSPSVIPRMASTIRGAVRLPSSPPDALAFEQLLLAPQATREPTQAAVAGDDSVTGDDYRCGVARARLRNGAVGRRPSDLCRDFGVGPRIARRYLAQRVPDLLLERGPPKGQRQV